MEVKTICEALSIPDINLSCVSKEKIYEAIFYNHYKDMKELMNSSKKMASICHEDFRQEQDYLNSRSVDSARTQLRIRLEMVDTFKDNFRSKYRTLERGEEDKLSQFIKRFSVAGVVLQLDGVVLLVTD